MNENNNSLAEGLVTDDETWNEFFDPDGDNPLGLSTEQANEFKNAIENLCYDGFYRPLIGKLEELEGIARLMKRLLMIVAAIQIFLILVTILEWMKA